MKRRANYGANPARAVSALGLLLADGPGNAQYCMLLRCWLQRAGCVSQDAYILHLFDANIIFSCPCTPDQV